MRTWVPHYRFSGNKPEYSILKPPYILRLLATFTRNSPPFSGKSRLVRHAAPFLRGKGYREIVKLKFGEECRFVCYIDDWISFLIFMYGCYIIESTHARFMLKVARPGMIMFDVGANARYYTILMASLLKRLGGGVVHSFEPMSGNQARFLENMKINQLDNATLVKNIVSNQNGMKEIFFNNPQNTGTSSIYNILETENSEKVEAITLDQYISQSGVQRVDLVKIDVEGHELEVLEGMNLSIERFSPDFFIEVNREILNSLGKSPNDLYKFLQGHGYRSYKITKNELVEGQPDNESLVYFTKTLEK